MTRKVCKRIFVCYVSVDFKDNCFDLNPYCLQDGLVRSDTAVGTPDYISPEVNEPTLKRSPESISLLHCKCVFMPLKSAFLLLMKL